MKPICLSLLVLTGTLLGARGETFRTDINPALLYYRAFLVPTEPMSEADRNYLSSKKGREQKLPERFGQIVASYDNQFQLVHQAAHATVPCDWGIDLSPGPNVMLPHLARAKAVCQTAQLRAVWALQQGRQADARDELLAAFVLGRNAASDGVLISALVQCMIEGLDYATVAQSFGEFSPETLRQLVDGFDAAPARHMMAACIPGEKSLGDWLLRKILELQKAYPNDDAKVMAAFRDAGYVSGMESVGETNLWPRLVAASGGTSEGLLKLLREAEPLLARVTELMALPPAEYETQAKQYSAEILKSQNPFITALGFIIDKWQKRGFRPREFRAQAELAMVHAAVEYKLNGESGLKSVRDPFGKGPFTIRRFVFKGVDRGFELKSAYAGADAPFVMIFVEKQGAAFQVAGPDAGKAIDK
jgi:hypothetical protein